MKFSPTPIAGAYIVDVEPRSDERGSFSRIFCTAEFGAAGIEFAAAQISIANSVHTLTLRGMHFNAPPFQEAKLVRCIRGSIHEVAIDLRRDSPSFRQWIGLELSHGNGRALFVPAGCAQGYLTLQADCDVLYQMDRAHVPGVDRGVRWDDPAFGVQWPQQPGVMHPRDANYPDYAG